MAALAKLRRAASGVCIQIERGWANRFLPPVYLPPNYEMDSLEKRQLLSVAAHINGPAEVTEGDPYVLSLSASSTASTYTVQNWSISYGDGGASFLFGDAVADLHTYNTASSPTYDITATVTDTEGTTTYSDSASMAVTVDEATASLYLSPGEAAAVGQPFDIYQELSDGGAHTLSGYSVAWGDSSSDSDSTTPESVTGSYSDDFTHTYAQSGTYGMTATAVTEQGTLTASTQIAVGAGFYLEDDGNGYTVGQDYDVTPYFDDPGHPVSSYTVSWGDGSADATYSGSASVFPHDYTADSTSPYDVTATAVADDGNWIAADELSVAPPTLALSAPSQVTQGQEYAITANVTSGETAGSTYAFDVDWGDGSSDQEINTTAGPLTYTYAQPGTYGISVEADGDDGAGDITYATVDVAVAVPTVGVNYQDATLTAGVAETFTDSYSNPGGDALDNLTVAWGDGDTDAYYLDPQQEAHTYAHPGTYNVTDTFVTDDATYTSGISADVIDAGTLNVSGSDQAIEGTAYTFNASLSEPDGQMPTGYCISWGDGQTDQDGPESQGTFTHVYNTLSGDEGYAINATATTVDGTFTAAMTHGVTVVPPYGNLYGSSVEAVQGGEPFEVVMFWDDGGGGYFPGYPVSGHIVTYSVNWGDGSSDTYIGDNTLAHAYSYYPTPTACQTDSPQFTVVATTDEGLIGLPGGGHATFTGGVAVYTPGGSATIDASFPSSAVEGDDVSGSATFTDSTQGPDDAEHGANHWEIIWGDGNSSGSNQSVNPSFTYDHTYTTAGEYTPTLVAEYLEESAPDWDGQGPYVAQTILSPIDISVASLTVTAVGDTTATVVGDTYSLSLGFSHNPAIGNEHVPLYYSIAWGDGTSDDYYADQYGNLADNPTHLYATASTGGSNYSVEVTACTDEGTYTPVTQPSVIVAQALMQVIQGDGTAMDHDAQHTFGAFVSLNDDDDGDQYDSNGDPISDLYQTSLSSADPDLVRVVLNALPSSVGGTFTVSYPSGDFDVYADPYKDQSVTSGQTYDATVAHTFYLEGTALSSQTANPYDLFSAAWGRLAAGLSVPVADFAAVNVVTMVGASYVPQNGDYTYKVSGAVPAPDMDSWQFVGGTKVGEAANGQGVIVSWDQGAVFGTVQAVVDQFAVRLPVHVFSVTVTAGTFTPGTPVGAGTGPYSPKSPAGTSPFSVFATSGKPGLNWTASVIVSGPVKSGGVNPDNGGIGLLRIGFIQNVVQGGYTNIGYYTNPANAGAPLTRTSSSDTYFSSHGPVLDGPPGAGPQNPWYAAPWTPTVAQPSTPNNAPLTNSDTPTAGTPLDFKKDVNPAAVAASANPLFQTDVEVKFALYVCAQTTQAINGANLVYAAEAEGDWKFNGSGTVAGAPKYVWTGPGSVTPPTGWNAVAPSTVPQTSGMIGNDVVDAAKFI